MLKDKVALITGGGSGIGRAISVLFSRHGALSVILDNKAEAAEGVAIEIEREGGKALPVCADVTSPTALQKAFEEIHKQASRLDILVNNAGIYCFRTAVTLDEPEWQRCLDIDLKGPWLCSKYGLPLMIETGGGSIINIGSTHAVRAQGHAFPYGVAKAGVAALTQSLAVDYGGQGIRANTICPGLVFSPMAEAYFGSKPSEDPDQIVAMQPLPIRIYTEDIANAALFLASDMARCITGTTLFVDGGRTIYSGIRHDD